MGDQSSRIFKTLRFETVQFMAQSDNHAITSKTYIIEKIYAVDEEYKVEDHSMAPKERV